MNDFEAGLFEQAQQLVGEVTPKNFAAKKNELVYLAGFANGEAREEILGLEEALLANLDLRGLKPK